MGDIIGAIFGGSATDAANAQVRSTEKAMEQYKQSVSEAKGEIRPAFERAKNQRLFRNQQSMDAMESAFTPSLDTMTQGNTNAQDIIANSGQQQMNAILGGPVDFSGMQSQPLNFDAQSFLSGMPSVYDENPMLDQEEEGYDRMTDPSNRQAQFGKRQNPFQEGSTSFINPVNGQPVNFGYNRPSSALKINNANNGMGGINTPFLGGRQPDSAASRRFLR